jgi:hypothetical protein
MFFHTGFQIRIDLQCGSGTNICLIADPYLFCEFNSNFVKLFFFSCPYFCYFEDLLKIIYSLFHEKNVKCNLYTLDSEPDPEIATQINANPDPKPRIHMQFLFRPTASPCSPHTCWTSRRNSTRRTSPPAPSTSSG